MKLNQAIRIAFVVVLGLRLAACGGNPAGPSPDGVTLEGTVVSGSFGASAARGSQSVAAVLTVQVAENPAINATIVDGRFMLRGLPEGGFTLVFRLDGAEIGRIPFAEVKPNQAITVSVAVTGNTVSVVEERRNGIGHGDLEIEGRVEQVLVVNPAGDSRFVIDGRTVVVRPGTTSIREGNRARVAAEIELGRQVHVKGVWQAAVPPAPQDVLAWEVKLQDGVVGSPAPSPSPGAACMINGGRQGDGIQLEGRVASGALPSFTMTVNGNRASGPVSVSAAGASVECSPAGGPNAPTPAQCQARVTGGQKVHVRGALTACTAAAALVTATSVRVQN